MKTALLVTLDDLEASAKDNDGKPYEYRQLCVRYLYKRYWYRFDDWPCTKEFATLKLVEYGKQPR